MLKVQFYPIDATYKVIDNKATVYLYGRGVDGKQICVVDKNFDPYFYVLANPEIRQKLLELKIEKDNETSQVLKVEQVRKNLNEKETEVFKVTVNLPSAVPVLREEIKQWGATCYEHDIKFVRRYLIDKGITPLTLVEAEGEQVHERSRVPVISAAKIQQASDEPIKEPRILAIDIETYNPLGKNVIPEQHPIIMLALYGRDFKKVLTWKHFPTTEAVEVLQNEAEMLERFKQLVEEYAPDILAGYYSDGFDMPYIKTRAQKHKVKLDIGIDYSELKLSSGAQTTAHVTGICHLDIFKFIKKVIGRSLETDVFTLDAVSAELLGSQKVVVDLDNLAHSWDHEPENLDQFARYNLHDARLTYDLCHTVWPNVVEMVKIIGLPLWDVSRMAFSQLDEWYLIRQAAVFNEIVPNRPSYQEQKAREAKRLKGAFVFEPTPGLYRNMAVFDYRSLYPTIIASHNISPGSLNCTCCPEAKKVPFEGVQWWYCAKKRGFLSSVIEDLISRRNRIKEIIKREGKSPLLAARSEGLKVLANSLFGYTGFAPARWYCFECAESILAWARSYIKMTIAEAQKLGFTVLYSDSLPYSRYVFVKDKNGGVGIRKIGELYESFQPGMRTLGLAKDFSVRFMPLKRVIKHKLSKDSKLLKFTTKYGTTIVTDRHSVYTYRNSLELAEAKALTKGDSLVSLTSPALDEVYREGQVLDILDLDWGEYRKELRLYPDNAIFSQKPGICPYCKRECRLLSSHVFAHHQNRKAPFAKESSFEWVGTAFAKAGRIPRYWILDAELAWLLGFYCAEGSVSNSKTRTGRKLLLSFGGQDKTLIRKVKSILDKKIRCDLKIIENIDPRIKKKMYYYRAQRIPIVGLFRYGFGAGKGSEFKRVPSFIFTAEEKLRRAFMEGYLDGDGNTWQDSRYKTKFIRFSTKSKELAIGLQFLLKTLHHGKNYFGKDIRHVAWQYRKDKPKINDLRLQSAPRCSQNFCASEIKSIDEVPREEYVYDLEVENCHNFVDAEGMILVHNTDSIFILLGEKKQEDALLFVEQINKTLPGIIELDLENFYPAGLFVSVKAGEGGAKKKYALVDSKGVMKIRGFETVRRNMSFIAKDVQRDVLEILLKELKPENAVAYVRKVIIELKEGKVPVERVVIHTQLSKDISEYENIGPHVAAAQRMKAKGTEAYPGSIIKYVIARGTGLIRDRVRLPEEIKAGEIDAEYYIDNQILPAVDRIFAVFGVKKEDLLGTTTQNKLAKWF